MAAPKPKGKTPPKKAPARKAKAATKAGYTGKTAAAAQHSVTKQYGLVKNAAGKWVQPDAAYLERQMVANGWGVGQTGVTPVNIGGERWLTGQGQLTYTGDRSDAAKRKPGAAYSPGSGQSAAQGLAGSSASGSLAAPWENIDLAGGGVPMTGGPAEEGEQVAQGESGKDKKKKRPAKKLVKRAKSPKSPGGSKVTPKERKAIRAVKVKPRPKKAAPKKR